MLPFAMRSLQPDLSYAQGEARGQGISFGCPGRGVTAATLATRWAALQGERDVVEFYGHSASSGDLACFSNFFDQSGDPFEFEVPPEMCAVELLPGRRIVSCVFSEKAIMLCKAAAMGDMRTYSEISVASRPSVTKSLGRRVRNFDSRHWDEIVCSVAFQVVFQKFRQTARLRHVLLATGEKLIAEATRNDKIWGIGIDRGDPRVRCPSRWNGANLLGWALMEARAALRHELQTSQASKPRSPCCETGYLLAQPKTVIELSDSEEAKDCGVSSKIGALLCTDTVAKKRRL